MKILKRNYRYRNLILFLLFSIVYLQAIRSLSAGQSIVDYDVLKTSLRGHYLTVLLSVLAVFMVFKQVRHSEKIVLAILVLISGESFFLLASSFNKMILVLNFIYLLFGFYFFITWELEIEKASTNPLFAQNDLEKERRFPIKGKLEMPDSTSFLKVALTNIDRESCFLLIEEEDFKDCLAHLGSNKKYRLSLEYEGVRFSHWGQIVSTYDRGVGIDFVSPPAAMGEATELNWSDLYHVCQQRGLFD